MEKWKEDWKKNKQVLLEKAGEKISSRCWLQATTKIPNKQPGGAEMVSHRIHVYYIYLRI